MGTKNNYYEIIQYACKSYKTILHKLSAIKIHSTKDSGYMSEFNANIYQVTIYTAKKEDLHLVALVLPQMKLCKTICIKNDSNMINECVPHKRTHLFLLMHRNQFNEPKPYKEILILYKIIIFSRTVH
jgi:hypothetical protein